MQGGRTHALRLRALGLALGFACLAAAIPAAAQTRDGSVVRAELERICRAPDPPAVQQ